MWAGGDVDGGEEPPGTTCVGLAATPACRVLGTVFRCATTAPCAPVPVPTPAPVGARVAACGHPRPVGTAGKRARSLAQGAPQGLDGSRPDGGPAARGGEMPRRPWGRWEPAGDSGCVRSVGQGLVSTPFSHGRGTRLPCGRSGMMRLVHVVRVGGPVCQWPTVRLRLPRVLP